MIILRCLPLLQMCVCLCDGGEAALWVKCPCLSDQTLESLQELALPSAGLARRTECLSVEPRRGMCGPVPVCALLGFCLCWLSSLLVTLRPGTAGPLLTTALTPPATYPLLRCLLLPVPALWPSEGVKGRWSHMKMRSGHAVLPQAQCPLGMREREGARGQAFLLGIGCPGGQAPHPPAHAWLQLVDIYFLGNSPC